MFNVLVEKNLKLSSCLLKKIFLKIFLKTINETELKLYKKKNLSI